MRALDRPAEGPRHASPPLLLVASVHVALFFAGFIVAAILSGGTVFPSPFGSLASAHSYFVEHGDAARMLGFFQVAAAIPLGILGVSAVSRLRFLGVDVAGVSIALLGAIGAPVLLVLSGGVGWTLGQAGVTDAPGTVRALHLFAFVAGGPGFAALFGLFVAGVSVAGGLTRRAPRWLMWFGLVVAAAAELSVFALVLEPAAYLLPVARFGGMVWLLALAIVLPSGRARRSTATASEAS
jgi:hypothetical protein